MVTRLAVPAVARKPDEFYRQVIAAYAEVVAGGERSPAARLAAENDVPVTTIHRWVREARRRGIDVPWWRPARRLPTIDPALYERAERAAGRLTVGLGFLVEHALTHYLDELDARFPDHP